MADAPAPDDEDAIRAQAIKLLARREHAQVELERKLDQRGYERAAIERVLAALTDDNLLSEMRYAAGMVRARVERGQGPVRIAAELSRVGVAQSQVDDALAEAEVDWFELAVAARRKRFGDTTPENREQRSKQIRFLQRRGFQQDMINAALETDAT